MLIRRDWIGLPCATDVAYATVHWKECFAEMSVSYLSTGYTHLDLFQTDSLLSNSPPFLDETVHLCNGNTTRLAHGHCNKFFPFTRGQLMLYDTVLFNIMDDLWMEISVWNDADDFMESPTVEDTVTL